MQTDTERTRHQNLRLKRVLWGGITYLCTLIIVSGYLAFDLIPVPQAIHFIVAVLLINIGAILLIKTNINLHFKDPSMTALQVFSALLPCVYIMYHVSDPQARIAFLLMATVAMLLGSLALNLKQMLSISILAIALYLALIAALACWAPERVNLKIESIIIFSYSVVLFGISYLGSFISGLRKTLRQRNQSLEETMNELQELVRKDPLTRLPNRLSIMEQLQREQARAERREPEQNQLCVCMLDIDHFKKINDTYGHQIGDAVLQCVGITLLKNIRQGDFIGRFGGEEFLLIMPEASRKNAEITTERIRLAIADMQVSKIGDHPPITISIGVAVHKKGTKIEQTINLADDALYQAKNSGRNTVVISNNTNCPPAE